MHWQTGFNADDYKVSSQFAAVGFDVSVQEVLSALLSGKQLVLLNNKHDLAGLWQQIDRYGIEQLYLPPVLLGDFWQQQPQRQNKQRESNCVSSLRSVVVAGQALQLEQGSVDFLTEPLTEHHSKQKSAKEKSSKQKSTKENHARYISNHYGPTETHVVSYFDVGANEANTYAPPIGRPINNVQLYILDSYQQPVPQGAIGELYIGGVGIANGYLNRPDLTEERFLANPFHPTNIDGTQGHMYKTGDLARYLPDGNIEYCGRNDFQVKIRGFRIELGEIEAKLNEAETVQTSTVLATGEGDTKQLVAYLIPEVKTALNEESLKTQLISDLRSKLANDLPDYMVPAAFMLLESWPLTPNGKLDTKALPAIDDSALAKAEFSAPQGETESALANLWSSLLGVEQVSRHDDFFNLGGHSLLAVRLINRLRSELEIDVPVATVFNQPRLSDLAKEVTQLSQKAGKSRPDISPVSRDQTLPLSFAQQRLWVLANMGDASSLAYHMPANLRLKGTLNVEALQASLNHIMTRHESLRSVFVENGNSFCQPIPPSRCSNSTIQSWTKKNKNLR